MLAEKYDICNQWNKFTAFMLYGVKITTKWKEEEKTITRLGDVPVVADGCYRFSSHRASTPNDGQLHWVTLDPLEERA